MHSARPRAPAHFRPHSRQATGADPCAGGRIGTPRCAQRASGRRGRARPAGLRRPPRGPARRFGLFGRAQLAAGPACCVIARTSTSAGRRSGRKRADNRTERTGAPAASPGLAWRWRRQDAHGPAWTAALFEPHPAGLVRWLAHVRTGLTWPLGLARRANYGPLRPEACRRARQGAWTSRWPLAARPSWRAGANGRTGAPGRWGVILYCRAGGPVRLINVGGWRGDAGHQCAAWPDNCTRQGGAKCAHLRALSARPGLGERPEAG